MTTYRKPNRYHHITPAQSKDAGMALVLIFLIIGFWINKLWPFEIATGALIMNMIWPGFFKTFAWFWYGLAEVLGMISSTIVLTLVYVVIVTPMGLLRKAMGKDRLMLTKFKKNAASTFSTRDHLFKKKDIEQPF